MINIPVEPEITSYLHNKAAKLRIPFNGTFELTPVCNMNCRMCYVRMSAQQQEAIRPLRTKEEWLALGEEAKKQGMLYLLLTGGEPFLRKDFKDILAGLHKMGFIITINSNGTLIDENVIEWLKETPPVRINMTIYGASDETYAKLCGNPHGFTQLKRAVHLLKEAGIMVKLNCSVTPYNAQDLEKMIVFAMEEHLVIQPTAYMFPPVRKDASMIGRNDRFTPEEAAYYSAKIESLLNGEENFVKRYENQSLALPSDPADDCLDIEGEGIRCRAGKCSFWVTWDGTLMPCGMLTGEQALNVFDAGLAQAWQNAIEYSSSIRLPAKCNACPIKMQCKACAAMVYTETGSFSEVPEYRCRMSRAFPEMCAKVLEEIRSRANEKENAD